MYNKSIKFPLKSLTWIQSYLLLLHTMDVLTILQPTVTILLLLLFLLLITHVVHFGSCFSLFRIRDSPQQYFLGDPLMVNVGKLISYDVLFPYAYYSVPFCRPDATLDTAGHEFLWNRLKGSPYVFKMQELQMCRIVCRMTLDEQSTKSFQEKIHESYRVNMVLDGLPVAVPRRIPTQEALVYQIGYQIGFIGFSSVTRVEDYQYFIDNHLIFTVKYVKDALTDYSKIVGFEVKPSSVKHEYEGKWDENTTLTTCKTHSKETYVSSGPQTIRVNEEIVFTYDVIFQESNVTWASRWDTYHHTQADELHFNAAINYLVTLIFYLGVVAIMIMRSYRDISKYNESDILEETGWKLVHGEVFRHPFNSDLLCCFAGTGVQCLATITTAILILSVSGFILPSDWDEFWRVILYLWALKGFFAGYSSARLYKMFDGTQWRKIASKTAFMLPGPAAIILFILNFLTYHQEPSSALPYGAMFSLILLWFGVSLPLVFVGSYFGFETQAIKHPVRTIKIPREIPEQPCYKKPIISILVGGILPFGAAFYELREIIASIWFHQFYTIQSFQFFAYLTLLATCAGTTVVICYFQLCREDYKWWGTSFLTSGISGVLEYILYLC